MNKFNLNNDDYNILKTILCTIPNKVYVYGSRAKGTSTKFSDIDLYIRGEISEEKMTSITTQLEESNLSIKVDLINKPSKDFLSAVEKDFILFVK